MTWCNAHKSYELFSEKINDLRAKYLVNCTCLVTCVVLANYNENNCVKENINVCSLKTTIV